MQAAYENFKKECKKFLLNAEECRIYDDYLRRFAYGIDASCYRYIPKLVLKPNNEEEVQKIILLSKKFNIPLTFRAAGTSLSGQACTNHVLVVCMKGWQRIEANENSLWCDCGVIASQANEALKKFGKKIGPDPATINNASIAGIFSNNSSGMCCGVKQNSYQTIKSVRVILNDGFILDTSDSENLKEFIQTHQKLVDELLSLRKEILEDKELCKEIERKFRIKNTTGYGLNTFIDFSDIKDLLNHIFIGAEGTLGFVSRVEYYAVENFKFKACALLFYENLSLASLAIKTLSKNDALVSAAEIMDYACLKAMSHMQGLPQILQELKEGNCCILIQLEENQKELLKNNTAFITKELENIPTLFGINFSFDEQEQASWWKIRKGLLPISAANKRPKSTVITEDICFEIDNFAKGIEGITKLFELYNFQGIIFGHALSGNVHFIITPLLDDVVEKENFAKFMDAMVNLVLTLKGSTKAEHGTGRMMAPFIEQEWGEKAYKINQRIKKIFDPQKLFNPDVILCEDSQIHIKNLKPSHQIEDYLEACMECGFCEKVCPSKNFTLTPRQRIAVHREIKRLQSLKEKSKEQEEELENLQKGYKYFVIDTCATCSMCSTLCPIEIDTAKIANSYYNNKASKKELFIAKTLSYHMDKTINLAKFGMSMLDFGSKILGQDRLERLSLKLNQKFNTPVILKTMPHKNSYTFKDKISNSCFKKNENSASVVYFSSCLNRAFSANKRPIQEVFESLCLKANIKLIYPKNIEKMCCGKAFKHYTQKEPSLNPLHFALQELLLCSCNGDIAIVCDHSACSAEILDRLKDLKGFEKLKIYDMSVFVKEFILSKLDIKALDENIGIYSVCATKKGGWADSLVELAQSCTKAKVYTHSGTYCCAFAGNKGFINPQFNQNALEDLKNHFKKLEVKKMYASSSTCELGLSVATDKNWEHIIYLLDEVSSAKTIENS